MGGSCGVTSNHGNGSCFWFTIRVKRDLDVELNAKRVDDIATLPVPASMIHVLIVEDNPLNQEVALAMLETMNCMCTVMENGAAALEALKKPNNFDIVLMDCQMPVMDGYQATTLFREYESLHHAAKRLPVVALTANAMQGDRDRCLLAGMDDFLSKPFRMKDLRETITKWNPRHIAQLQPGSETF